MPAIGAFGLQFAAALTEIRLVSHSAQLSDCNVEVGQLHGCCGVYSWLSLISTLTPIDHLVMQNFLLDFDFS